MLAYAASRPAPVERRPHPNALLAIIAVHVAVAALVMSAKMDLPHRILGTRTDVIFIPTPKPPPPNQPQTSHSTQQSHETVIDRTQTEVTLPPTTDRIFGDDPKPLDPGVIAGGGAAVIPELPPPHFAVKLGPRLATPDAELKPPYPASKLLTEEEAALRLRLTIDASGRVIAVDPVGKADPVFLSAARRHLIAHWRYRPATEDGRAIISTEVITLRFELDG